MALVTDLTARRLVTALGVEQREGRLPSVAAALTRDRALVWRGSCGDETGAPGVRAAELQYRIGSITKTMTAVLIMQLRDEGKVSLNDPLGRYLDLPRFGDLTLRSLLSHAAGLPAEPLGPWWERTEGGSLADLVAKLGETAAPFVPGHTHHYSNLGYGLLGAVVEQVRGTSWWECLSEHLLAPLGMLRTSYDAFEMHATGYSVHPYLQTLSEEPAVDTGAMAPAGQVWSTVLDLATYADFLITGHPEVLSSRTLEEMCTPQTGASYDGLSTGYGLGLRLVPGGAGVLVGHTGSMPGFQASLFVDRVRRAGAVVLANATTGLRSDAAAPRLLEVLEECEPATPDPWVPVDEVPPGVADVVGVWHWGNTPYVMTWDGTFLRSVHLTSGAHRDTYRLDGESFVGVEGYHHGEQLEVVRRADGSVSHLECATFVYTRAPYDPEAPIPGGPPVDA